MCHIEITSTMLPQHRPIVRQIVADLANICSAAVIKSAPFGSQLGTYIYAFLIFLGTLICLHHPSRHKMSSLGSPFEHWNSVFQEIRLKRKNRGSYLVPLHLISTNHSTCYFLRIFMTDTLLSIIGKAIQKPAMYPHTTSCWQSRCHAGRVGGQQWLHIHRCCAGQQASVDVEHHKWTYGF